MIRRSRLRSVSAKERTRQVQWRKIKAAIRVRSGGRCEVAYGYGPGNRCLLNATETHHVVKRSQGGQHDVNGCLDICHYHHLRTDRAYADGRLVITALGDGRFTCRIVFAESKFSLRANPPDGKLDAASDVPQGRRSSSRRPVSSRPSGGGHA